MLTFATAASQAALITWGTATTISGDTDVSTNGILVGAYNLGDTGVISTTINGITFAPFLVVPFAGSSASVGNFTLAPTTGQFLNSFNGTGASVGTYAGLSASYRALLGTEAGGSLQNQGITLTMSGLAVGQTYQFQWWANASNGPWEVVTTATAGGSVTLDWNDTDAIGGVGQFAIGAFIADDVNQRINFLAPVGQTFLNGFQLRQTSPVPEPTTALFGLGLVGFSTTARRRLRVS